MSKDIVSVLEFSSSDLDEDDNDDLGKSFFKLWNVLRFREN